jgi:acyl dehydratase
MSTLTLDVGFRATGRARTITDAEIALLPAMMGAMNPLFHDEETARHTKVGRRILYGPALLGIAIAGTEHLVHDIVIGLIGITDIRFRAAVGSGDTVTPSLTVCELLPKPDKAGDLVVVDDTVHNQNGVLVLEFRRTIMVQRSPH